MSTRTEIDDDQLYLKHEGVSINDGAPGRGSGRYAWGSGDNPYQHGTSFLGEVHKLQEKGLTETEIAAAFGMKTTEFRAKKSIAKAEKRNADAAHALKLKDKGYSNVKIGELMGINESSVRALLDPTLQKRNDVTRNVADILEQNVKDKKYIDVTAGVERELGVSNTRLNTAVAMLKEQGYQIQYLKVPQVNNPGKFTWMKILVGPDTTYSEVRDNMDKIKTVVEYSSDNGETFLGLKPPKSIDSSRIDIRYGDQGGSELDGVIQLRPGVEDISLGNAHYAQVRIAVDGTHYMKGMAMYSNDLPEGIDIIYNTNKQSGTPKEKVFKEMKDDPDNPFGATIKAKGQRTYIDENGKEQLSVINKVNEEGDWAKWSKTLSSQMLSKQPKELIERQLNLSYANKKAEFDDIKAITNPVLKKKLLESFADDCDASAVHLKAAALPRQASKVILPITSLKDNEIYAPTYKDGETVVLIRYPHAGIFEIPTLKVNNKQKEAKELLGNAVDAVGINSHVAGILSGADFDGDSVLVIPVNNKVHVKTSDPLPGLKGFDPKESYPGYEGMKPLTEKRKQIEMGKISNLITDMTIKGADFDEIARADRHSMVVIDAVKHNLDWERSYKENGIAELKKMYQGGANKGASTLISKSSSDYYVPARKPYRYSKNSIDPETGAKIYQQADGWLNKKGEMVYRSEASTKMAETSDAKSLSSGYIQEEIYANYANSLKNMGNEARKEFLATPSFHYSPSAAKAYKPEVETLNAKLDVALKNAPRERQAQLVANSVINMKKKDNPELADPRNKAELKKVSAQALSASRSRLGAKKKRIDISDKEWEAIQAGAISENKLAQILDNTDIDILKEKAMPRQTAILNPAKIARIEAMNRSGFTIAEIADTLGVSTSTISKALAPKEE